MFITFYDTETTSIHPTTGRIIQIAIMVMHVDAANNHTWTPMGEFERKIQFDVEKADKDALEVNSYDKDLWDAEAIPEKAALQEMDDFLKMYRDVKRTSKKSGKSFHCLRTAGHNISQFDDAFVRQAYKRNNMFCPFDYGARLDTLSLARWLFAMWYPEYDLKDHKLETLCDAYGIKMENAHDALSDVRANARLAWSMRYCKPKPQETENDA